MKRTYQSEKKVEIRLGFRREDDDVHDLQMSHGREQIHASVRIIRRRLQPATFSKLTQTIAPTEQVSITVLIRRSITWSTDAKPKSATSFRATDRKKNWTCLTYFGNRSFPCVGSRAGARCTRFLVSSDPNRVCVLPWDVRNENCTRNQVSNVLEEVERGLVPYHQ